MKKISIIFAILAVFILLASCTNGGVDLAGNPVNIAGTWTGTIAYKQDADPDLPMACVPTVIGGAIVGYTDYSGTYVVEDSFTPPADYDEVDNTTGTPVTYHHLFYMDATNTTTTTVINSDGSMVETEVEVITRSARSAFSAAPNVYYYIHSNINNLNTTGGPVTTTNAVVAGTQTITTTTTYSTPVVNAAGSYDYTVNEITQTVNTGDFGNTTVTQQTATNYQTQTKATIQNNIDNIDIDDRTVAPTLVPVVWQNDITETITLEVTKDGLYTLTNVITETQAAAEAAAATETNYASAERKAGTKTTTKTTTGTVAAWEDPELTDKASVAYMVLSSGVVTTSEDVTEFFVNGYTDIPTVEKFTGAAEYEIRFFEGKGSRKETAKTRMYVKVGDDLDPNGCIVIFDKAAEEEPEEE